MREERKRREEEIRRQNELRKREEIERKNEEIRKIKEKKRQFEEYIRKKEEYQKQFEKNMMNQTLHIENRPNQLFICGEDGKRIISERAYIQHFDEEHPNLFPFFCNICDKGFNSLNSLLDHKQNSLKHKRGNNARNFYCKVCKRRFASKFALNSHLKDKGHYLSRARGRSFLSKMPINNSFEE